MRFYPQFVTLFTEHACPALLCTLRLVSRWTRSEVDLRLVRHLSLVDDKETTAFLGLPTDTLSTVAKIWHVRHGPTVLDMDQNALADWAASRLASRQEMEVSSGVPAAKSPLLVRYHMRDVVGRGNFYPWRPAPRAVHFVDVPGLFYGLHARLPGPRPEFESTVFNISYDLSAAGSWEFDEFGVRRVRNRGLTLIFSREAQLYESPNVRKPYVVVLRLLERIVENYALTGDSATLVGVEDWHDDLVPSPHDMELEIRTGWESGMSMQAKVEWWVAHYARAVPVMRWAPLDAVRCPSLEEWRDEQGIMYDLMIDPAAVYWGP